MCKHLADILFPLNIFGKKVRCVTYDTSSTPRIDNKKTFIIEWVGERLDISATYEYAVRVTDPMPPHWDIKYPPIILNLTTSGTITLETDDFNIRGLTYKYIVPNAIYFKCTKVTKLIVNGEQII